MRITADRDKCVGVAHLCVRRLRHRMTRMLAQRASFVTDGLVMLTLAAGFDLGYGSYLVESATTFNTVDLQCPKRVSSRGTLSREQSNIRPE
jgi:hypothetical protein